MSGLIIEASTPLCLLQDTGRFGVRHLGVTQGGALDWVSMSWANWLLDNALDAPVVEITLGGFTVQAEDYCLLALAGADLGAYIDQRAISPGRKRASGCALPSRSAARGPTWRRRAGLMRRRCWAAVPPWCVRRSAGWTVSANRWRKAGDWLIPARAVR
jgi:hypothetical protein